MNQWTAPPYIQPDGNALRDGTVVPTLPTVRVKSSDTASGYVIINESDRTADHELHADPVVAQASKKKA